MKSAPTKTKQSRTGIHNATDRAEGGTVAPVRDCAYYGCRGGGWHEADCPGAGIYGDSNRYLDRRDVDVRTPVRRYTGGKNRTGES